MGTSSEVLYCMVAVKGCMIVTLYVSVVTLQMYLTVCVVMFMGLNVNFSVRVGGWPGKFPVRVVVMVYVLGFHVVVFMVRNCSLIVVFSFIVISRVVWLTLCVVLVMLSVMFVLNGVVLRLFVSLIVMLNVGSVVSIPVVLIPLMVGWMSCIRSVSLLWSMSMYFCPL